jgi:Leucine-rich repeat (LRR) protein
MRREQFLDILNAHDLMKADTLDLRRRKIARLYPEIGDFPIFRRVLVSGNYLDELPPEIGRLTRLEELDLDHNRLTELPPSLGSLHKLRTLRLANNRLVSLPDELRDLVELDDLSLRGNNLPEIRALRVTRRALRYVAAGAKLFMFASTCRWLPCGNSWRRNGVGS